jgi:hypothetical protein
MNMTAAVRLPDEPDVLRVVLRLVTKEEPFEQALKKVCEAVRLLGTVSEAPSDLTDENAEDIKAELDSLRRRAKALKAFDDSNLIDLVRRESGNDLAAKFAQAVRDATETVSARRTYLAWVLDEDDDRALGREIALPEPNVAPGSSSRSFAW